MKKFFTVSLALIVLTTTSFATTAGVGARFAAMGGAGATLVEDTYSAYYNPAGIVRSQAVALKIGAGTAQEGMDKLIQTLSSATDPSKFLLDNYANAIDVKGSANAFIGLSIAKMGISIMPFTELAVAKLANTVNGTALANLNGVGALTLGRGLSVPYLGSINLGANVKYIISAYGSSNVTGSTANTTGLFYQGMGFDIGAIGKVDVIPMMPLSVGVVMKNLGTTLKGNVTNINKVVDPITGAVQSETSTTTTAPDYTMPSTFVIGASGKIPVVGAVVAIDIENVGQDNTYSVPAHSITHIGIEYPLLMGIINLRAGKVSGGPAGREMDLTTFGAGLLGNTINAAMITDNKNNKNNQIMIDIGIGL